MNSFLGAIDDFSDMLLGTVDSLTIHLPLRALAGLFRLALRHSICHSCSCAGTKKGAYDRSSAYFAIPVLFRFDPVDLDRGVGSDVVDNDPRTLR